MKRLVTVGALWGTALLVFPSVALSHNRIVHMDMVDFAYQIMRFVDVPGRIFVREVGQPPATDFQLELPPDISLSQWNDFIARITGAIPKLDDLEADLPAPQSEVCGLEQVLTNLRLTPSWAQGYPIGSIPHAVQPNYVTGSGCGIREGWKPGGILNVSTNLDKHAGVVLGFWAGSIDDEIDDTHLWVRPTSVGGLGKAKDIVDDGVDAGLTVALVPVVCLFDCIFNSCSDCISRAEDLADTANPIDDLEGLIPGVGDITGGDYTGMWHHLNLTPGRSNEYDDHQGLYLEEAGLGGVPGALDIAIMVAADLSGLSLNYSESNGPHRYQVSGAADGLADTKRRKQAAWQFNTISSLAFSPLDNLAYYGWKNFRDGAKTPQNLGWPLHALGDATAPQHVIGAVGWGHRPAEDAIERLWPAIRYMDDEFADATSSQEQQQRQQVFRILLHAYRALEVVDTWREASPAQREKDVPIRLLVTRLAERTYAYATGEQQKSSGAPLVIPGPVDPMGLTGKWPYNDVASLLYLVDKDLSMKPYLERPDAAGLARPLIEDGVGSMIAFFAAVGETL